MSSRVVYVGNLPLDVRERELEDLFYKYGRIERLDLKLGARPPGFAFVEYSSSSAAYDAVKGRDGYDFYGSKLRVELSNGGSRSGAVGGGGFAGGGRDNIRGLGPSPFGPSRRTDFRVIVTGLPNSCSWQDLKDHMRRGGEVTFTQVLRDPDRRGMMGLVDYASLDDMQRAIRKLDDTEFRNIFDRAYIRVKEDRSSGGGGGGGGGGSSRRSRTRSRSRSRSRRRSPSRSRSRSRGRSRSRSVSKSRSRSRSRSASPRRDSRSRSRSKSRSPTPKRKSASRSPSPRRSVSRSPAEKRKPSASRSRSPDA